MPSGALLFQSVLLGLLLGGLYALLAAGLTLYFGIMRVVMIAHSAFLILAAYLAWWSHTRLGVDRTALRLMAGGATMFVLSAPVDVINHRINGLDITSWSVTHFGLYVGTAIMIAGVIRGWHSSGSGLPRYRLMLGGFWFLFLENVWFPAQHQEYGVEAIAAWDRGDPHAEPSLLQFAADQLGRAVDREAVVGAPGLIPAGQQRGGGQHSQIVGPRHFLHGSGPTLFA